MKSNVFPFLDLVFAVYFKKLQGAFLNGGGGGRGRGKQVLELVKD